MRRMALRNLYKGGFLALVLMSIYGTTASGITVANNQTYDTEIGGWGPFYFGMPFGSAKELLRDLCDDVTPASKYSSISGSNCGMAYGKKYDISLMESEAWFYKKLISVTITLEYEKAILANLIEESKTRWLYYSDWKCIEDEPLKDWCLIKFGSHGRLNISHFKKRNKIELMYFDFERW